MGVTAVVGGVADTVDVVAMLAVVDGATEVLEPQETSATRAARERHKAGEKRRMW